MASQSDGEESSPAEDSAGERHLKFRCAYKQKLSTSTCETDSAAQSGRSDNDTAQWSPEIKVSATEQDAGVYSELKRIREELDVQRKENMEMKEMMTEILGECRKLSTLYTDMKFEMLSIKGISGEGKPVSGKYVKNKAMSRNRRKTSPSSLALFSGSNTEKPNNEDS